MATHLSSFFQDRRIEKNLRRVDLAQLCGYQNLTKGANRIQKFEERGDVHPDLFQKLAAALEIDNDTIHALIQQDQQAYRAAWLRWVNTPVAMCVRIRRAPMFVPPLAVPEEITSQEDAERWTAEQTATWGPLLLLVSRKVSVAFDKDGQVIGRYEASPEKISLPYMSLGRHRFRFLAGEGGLTVQIDDQPCAPHGGTAE